MKRYIALLTFSFLSSTPLLHAGFNPETAKPDEIEIKINKLTVKLEGRSQAECAVIGERIAALKTLKDNKSEDAVASYKRSAEKSASLKDAKTKQIASFIFDQQNRFRHAANHIIWGNFQFLEHPEDFAMTANSEEWYNHMLSVFPELKQNPLAPNFTEIKQRV